MVQKNFLIPIYYSYLTLILHCTKYIKIVFLENKMAALQHIFLESCT